jgi:hypothetical protein
VCGVRYAVGVLQLAECGVVPGPIWPTLPLPLPLTVGISSDLAEPANWIWLSSMAITWRRATGKVEGRTVVSLLLHASQSANFRKVPQSPHDSAHARTIAKKT